MIVILIGQYKVFILHCAGVNIITVVVHWDKVLKPLIGTGPYFGPKSTQLKMLTSAKPKHLYNSNIFLTRLKPTKILNSKIKF